ncbi:hypothetical protein BpHYR1_018031 [Brachionus plicatilis]|uniref:Uncharacterized protein n=1 Tax=Brachionus plicatilis TaxID=10195 RepID=A0A3M7SXV1_BRAPC|nr:hypothetical protein BpHYR1_018031 [Brachionus plicatilis]
MYDSSRLVSFRGLQDLNQLFLVEIWYYPSIDQLLATFEPQILFFAHFNGRNAKMKANKNGIVNIILMFLTF